MHVSGPLRSSAVMSAAVVCAGAIFAAPAVLPAQPARAFAADIALTAVDWSQIEFWTNNGSYTFSFESDAEAQAYADEISAQFFELGPTLVQWANWLDPILSFAGISGVGAWVSDFYDLAAEILTPGWDPVAWSEDFVSAFVADPAGLFAPVADVDLGWFWGLLGISASDSEQLDSLLETVSGIYGATVTLGVLNGDVMNAGVINAINAGIFDPNSLVLGELDQDLIDVLSGDSFLAYFSSTQETLTNSLESALDILGSAPVIQWIVDLVGQLADGIGFEIPF